MNIDFTLTGLVDVIGLVQGVVLGAVFMVRGRRHQSFIFLGLFLLGYAGSLAAIVLDEWGISERQPSLLFLPFNFFFSTASALYLYVRSLTKGLPFKMIAYHMWPAIVEFAVFAALFLLPNTIKVDLRANAGFSIFMSIYHAGAMVYSLVYLIKVFYLARTHNIQIEAYYSNLEGKLLTWVQWIAGYIVITIGILLFLILLRLDEAYPNLIFWLSLINVTFIYTVAITALSQIRVVLPEDIDDDSGNVQIPRMAPYQSATQRSALANEPADLIPFGESDELRQISTRIRDRRYYRDAGLTLGDLAKKLHYSQRRLSNLINDAGGTNFSAYIHQFRVESAMEMLTDPAYANYTMTAVADEVGFSSKATFYAVFKKVTGNTPLQYQREQQLTGV